MADPHAEPMSAHGTDLHETVAHEGAHEPASPLQVDGQMVAWTWVMFALVAVVLYKYVWKPILAGLDQRESGIRKSIEDAEEIQRQMETLGEKTRGMIAEADQKARDIVDASRKAATEAARVIEDKGREESRILLENATREIAAAREKASASLRLESAQLAVDLAGKILQEELSPKKQQELTTKLIQGL